MTYHTSNKIPYSHVIPTPYYPNGGLGHLSLAPFTYQYAQQEYNTGVAYNPTPLNVAKVSTNHMHLMATSVSQDGSSDTSDFSDSSTDSGQGHKKKRTLTPPDEAVYRCEECNKGFGRIWNYKAHLETHNPYRKREYSCSTCDKTFVRRNDLERHTASKHSNKKDFGCSRCSRRFARKDTLQRHEQDGCKHRTKVPKRAGLPGHPAQAPYSVIYSPTISPGNPTWLTNGLSLFPNSQAHCGTLDGPGLPM